MKAKKDLKSSDIRNLFFHYLIPSIGGMLGTSLYVLGDTMLVGRGLGSQGLVSLRFALSRVSCSYIC